MSLVAGLPADLPCALFVVVHIRPSYPSALPEILDRAGPLPARHAVDGEAILPGQIYVALPDRHLLIRRGRVELTSDPRENRCRPAIDPLFRSAARAYGPRVIGVILSGGLSDGSAGLLAIKTRGGLAIVQDPADALVDSMPRSALRVVEADEVLPVAAIGPAIARLVRESAEEGEAAMTDHAERLH